MNLFLAILTIVLVLTILCELYLIYYTFSRRSMPGAQAFIHLIVTMIIYNGAYIGEINSKTYIDAIAWYKIEHIGICIQIYFWLIMCIQYARLNKKIIRIIQCFAILHPITFYIVFFTNDIFHLYVKNFQFISNGYFYVLRAERGILYFWMLNIGSLLALASTAIYLRGFLVAPKPHRSGYLMMVIASLFPWASVYIGASKYNTLGLDYYPILTCVTCLFYVFGIFRYNIFKTMPIATELVYRQSSAGIFLVDTNNQIIDANDKMIQLYPDLKKINRGITLEVFVQRHPEFVHIFEEKLFEFHYFREDGENHFRSEVTDMIAQEMNIGKIVKCIDITEEYEQRKLLQMIAIDAMDKAETNEMSFLQAQINPHFINNTLSVIASMITRAPADAKRLITELGEYLASCYYFDNDSPMVSLENEIETVNTYVYIEKARFGNRIQFNLVAEEIPNIRIPRLVLQPLVENAIRHGILKKAEGGTVYLIIKRWNNKVFFDVRDNGVGIPEEQLKNLDICHGNKKGIGITNIHRRLIKYYQEGLTIKRTVTGTSVSFWIPLNNTSDNSEED